MPIETGNTIASLDPLWPLSGDFIVQGDNHLRLLKAVLRAQFPGKNGAGFAKAITASEDEINFLGGLTSNIQEQFNNLGDRNALVAPAGTQMIFKMSSPPTGWRNAGANNDSLLRVVSTTGGGNGGSDSPISFSVPAHNHTTAGHALTENEMPSHKHSVYSTTIAGGPGGGQGGGPGSANGETSSAGGGASHSHGNTGSKSAVNFRPKYVNIIVAIKE